MVNVLANLVQFVVKNYHQRIIVGEIMREIERIDIKDLSKDSSGPRAISHFLCEIAERCPDEMMPCIPNLLSFLDQDSYPMRNATLVIIGIVVSNVLSKDTLTFSEKKQRDELLDKLENHILDINSFTRGRALQVWSRLFMERKVPLKRLNPLIEEVVGRLQDKSTYVRKNAVQLLNSFLKYNPLADKLNSYILRDVYNREKDYLDHLIEAKFNFDCNENEISKESEEKMRSWSKIESHLILFHQSNPDLANIDKETESEEFNIDHFLEQSKHWLEKENYEEAIKTYYLMKNNFPNHEIFDQDLQSEEPAQNEEEDDDNWKEIPKMTATFKKIFFDNSLNRTKNDISEGCLNEELEKMVQTSSNNTQRARNKMGLSELSHLSHDTLKGLIQKQQILINYISDLIKISDQIKISIPLVCSLLHSKNIQDVQEAIEFFVTAYKFGLKNEAYIGIRKMIVLIFSSEAAKKSAVIEAYKKLFIDISKSDKLSDYDKAVIVVKNLMENLSGASFEEVISLQELLKELMILKDIDKFTLRFLWEKYTLKSCETSEKESRLAIHLISMIASSNHNLIRDNLDILIVTGLGDRSVYDLELVRLTCIALNKSIINQGSIVTTETPYRLPKNHNLFIKLSDILVSSLPKLELKNWFSMSDEAVKVIFNLAENPDSICESIIYRILKYFLEFKSANDTCSSQSSEQNGDKGSDDSTDNEVASCTDLTNDNKKVPSKDSRIDSLILSRFISLIGSISLNLLVHLEVNIFTEMKTRNVIKEEKKNHKCNSSATKVSIKRKKTKSNKSNNEEDILGVSESGTTEDAEAQLISDICNNDILEVGKKSENLLAKLSKLVIKIATNPAEYPDPMLRATASLALAKSMTISERFCSTHLRVLFTILSKSKEPIIRSNTIIGIGDLCVRFPNRLDPWTPNLYQALRDPCVAVRTYALKVLSRLILSDMIKVKEQISEIAKLIVDSQEELSSFAKLFFTQLSKKQNAIYNVIPDIISNLSDLKVGIKDTEFRQVMKFMFELIDKERHTIGLVEKLCQRFRVTT